MRLGGQVCHLLAGSKIANIYGKSAIEERHRHRYEVNQSYADALSSAGMVISGRSVDQLLVEVVELEDHPWFVACQFHPEFTSWPIGGHPLFIDFINAATAYQDSHS